MSTVRSRPHGPLPLSATRLTRGLLAALAVVAAAAVVATAISLLGLPAAAHAVLVLPTAVAVLASIRTGRIRDRLGWASADDMHRAIDIQSSLGPSPALVTHGPLHVLGKVMPATGCGGDWWTFHRLAQDRALVVVGDAMGHGVPAAMLVAVARGALASLARQGEQAMRPASVLHAIGEAISPTGVPMTAFAALIDPRHGQLEYANAGHVPPWLLRHIGPRQLELTCLLASSNPLVSEPRCVRFGTTAFGPGDLLVLFSDGLVDRRDWRGRRLGERRLRGFLPRAPLPSRRTLVSELHAHILDQARAFSGTRATDDDVTLVLCQYSADYPQPRPAQTVAGNRSPVEDAARAPTGPPELPVSKVVEPA
jgi:phosphoserine phosphatase RsbU/P